MSSFLKDGLAFCALLHNYDHNCLDYNKLDPNNQQKNLEIAFQTAKKMGIKDVLSVGEMGQPDELKVIEYLSFYYQKLKGRSRTDTVFGEKIDMKKEVNSMKKEKAQPLKKVSKQVNPNKDRLEDVRVSSTNFWGRTLFFPQFSCFAVNSTFFSLSQKRRTNPK